ncbi:hypothetical protein D3C78_1143860 [compost metagenome]
MKPANAHDECFPVVYPCLEFLPPAADLPATIPLINGVLLLHCFPGDGIVSFHQQNVHQLHYFALNVGTEWCLQRYAGFVLLQQLNDSFVPIGFADVVILQIQAAGRHYLQHPFANVYAQ